MIIEKDLLDQSLDLLPKMLESENLDLARINQKLSNMIPFLDALLDDIFRNNYKYKARKLIFNFEEELENKVKQSEFRGDYENKKAKINEINEKLKNLYQAILDLATSLEEIKTFLSLFSEEHSQL